MEPIDNEDVLKLAEAVADGQPWDAASADDDPLVAQLRVLARLSDVHRSEVLEGTGARRPFTPEPAPAEWGPFKIVEEIGRGSFGVVYRARDVRLDRDIALKLFPPQVDAGRTPTIVSEGRLLAKVLHPNIITVFGADVIDGRVGIWMEHLQGRTLQQELDDRGPLGAREAALIGIDICRALAAVHHAGLVHRDVKAQNVMRAEGGRIMLMDFGAGRETAEIHRDVLAGTPLYMAPEVIAGGTATAAADLYSLGVLLYHLVTNDFPVTASTLDELRAAHASGTPKRLRDVRPDLPASFIKTVEDATAPDPDSRIPTAAAFESRLEAVLVSTDGPRSVRWPWRRLVTAAALLVSASLAVGFYSDNIRNFLSLAPSATGIRSLVILPFDNLTGQENQDYLAASITQIINGNLAALKPLSVTSNASAMSYKDKKLDVAEIAAQLEVDGIVSGGVTKSGDKVLINVELRRADGAVVWSGAFEPTDETLFPVTGQIAQGIADAIRLSLTAQERQALRQIPGMQGEALEAFLHGLQRLNFFQPESLKLALVDLQRAVSLDETSARAFAALSQCYRLLAASGDTTIVEPQKKALAAATKALELDPTIAQAHLEIAEVKFNYEWNWQEAGRAYQQALDRNPNNSQAMARYSQYLAALGRFDEAIPLAKEALRLDPFTTGALSVRYAPGMTLYYARQYDEAIAEFQALAKLPPYTLFGSDYVGLGRALAARGRYDEAVAALQNALRELPHPAWKSELARIHADAGHVNEARRLLAELRSQGAQPIYIATVLIALGETDAALAELNRAADKRAVSLLWMNVDPRFDPIRSDPRFRELADRIGIPR